jgi:hypothetical protein
VLRLDVPVPRINGARSDSDRVTSRFYDGFRRQHAALEQAIGGVAENELRRWYASGLMNRLMFVCFLQKEGFLGGDRDFLRARLTRVRELEGPDAFYRTLLLPLFHHGFGSPEHAYPDADVAAIAGDVPYVDGGLFEEHAIEAGHEIAIPDAVFEAILDFFDGFTWHLGDRPHGDPDAVDPDVIGHVFERHINLTSTGKKEAGAYYTKADVTGYMVAATLVPRLLERIVADTGVDPFALLRENPSRYVPEALLHGGRLPAPAEWTDPARWSELDALPADEALQLPGESWIETLDRREHAQALLAAVAAGAVDTVDELVTRNLDVRTLLGDVIRELDSAAGVQAAWEATTATRVIDPTCGSGAFLFAALEVLEDVYAALLERARAAAVEPIVAAADAHPGDAYHCRVHAALSNLHGLDLMPEAVETAKLRLGLALVSTLERTEQIGPLPDLGRNLRAGNLLAGSLDLPRGFDVVVGNPPYVNRRDVSYPIGGLTTADAPDIYAPALERSLQLLHPEGRLAFIVPISFQAGKEFAQARRLVAARGPAWISTYSRRPSTLFTGAGVRSSIVISAAGAPAVHTTETRRWQHRGRDTLFQTTRYSALGEHARRDDLFLRTGDDDLAALFEALLATGGRLGDSARRDGAYPLGFKAFALYYLSAYAKQPPALDLRGELVAPPADKAIRFATEDERALAFAILAGELGLVWWMSAADDFNVQSGVVASTPIPLGPLERDEELVGAARALVRDAHSPANLMFNTYNRMEIGSWDLRRISGASIALDRRILEALGLLEYWPAVRRAVRRFQKSTGESPGVRRGLGWLDPATAGKAEAWLDLARF